MAAKRIPNRRSNKLVPAGSRAAGEEIFLRLFADTVPKSYQMKFAIVQAALTLFTEGGVHSVTFELVAKKVGVGRSHIAYHFPRLIDLYVIALKYMLDTVHQATIDEIQKAQSSRDQMLAPIRAIFSWAQADPTRPRALTALFHLAGHTQECTVLHSQIRVAGQRRLAELIVRYRPEISSRSAEIELVCRIIQSLSLGAIIALGSTSPGGLAVIPSCEEIGNALLQSVDSISI